jgi:hypothetical protein
MITFFATAKCRECGAIEEALQTLCLAHELVLAAGDQKPPKGLPPGTLLPAMVDGKSILQGHRDILEHVQQLEAVKALWDKYQSDACHCGDDGEIE